MQPKHVVADVWEVWRYGMKEFCVYLLVVVVSLQKGSAILPSIITFVTHILSNKTHLNF